MKNLLRRSSCWGVLAAILGTGLLQGTSRIEYTISLKDRAESLLQVRMRLREIPDQPVHLALPVWNNTYQVRDFVRFIERIEAVTSEGYPLQLRRTAKSSWQLVPQGNRDVEIRYPGYRRPENSISYYNKGLLICMLLDLEIRHRTGNQRSLDDVIRLMNVWFGGRGVGFRPGDIQRAVESVAQSRFDDFFNRFVVGVDELPYEQVLAIAGLELNRVPSSNFDPGGSPQQDEEDFEI